LELRHTATVASNGPSEKEDKGTRRSFFLSPSAFSENASEKLVQYKEFCALLNNKESE